MPDILEAYPIICEAAEWAYHRYVKKNFEDAEDLAHGSATHFMEKEYLSKFKGTKSTFRYFVFVGVRNYTINLLKSKKNQIYFKSISTVVGSDGEETLLADLLPTKEPDFIDGMILNELLDIIPSGSGRVDAQETIRLLVNGYSKKDVAKKFGVSSAWITQVVRKVASNLGFCRPRVFQDNQIIVEELHRFLLEATEEVKVEHPINEYLLSEIRCYLCRGGDEEPPVRILVSELSEYKGLLHSEYDSGRTQQLPSIPEGAVL